MCHLSLPFQQAVSHLVCPVPSWTTDPCFDAAWAHGIEMMEQTHLRLLQEDCMAWRRGAEIGTKWRGYGYGYSSSVCSCSTEWPLGLRKTHHSRVEVVRLYGWGGHRAVDSLLFLTTVAEPDTDHLLLHGQLLWDQRNLLWVGLGILQGHVSLLVMC